MEGPPCGGSCQRVSLMARLLLRLLVYVAALAPTVLAANQIKGLDDAILFRLNWAGSNGDLLDSPDYEKLVMTSSMNERYECLVPIKYGLSTDEPSIYKGPGPLALLLPLFVKKPCNLRLETFWTYELCHGHHIKQFREEHVGKNTHLLEFTLGRFSEESLEKLTKQAEEEAETQQLLSASNIPTTKVEGVDTPYFMVNYTDGSYCDLTGRLRISHVLFVCFEDGRNDMYTIKETFTCEYEIVVLTPYLCQHPFYRPKELPQTNLHCIPMKGSPKRPRNMLQIEAESLKLRSSKSILTGDTSSGSVKLEVQESEKDKDKDHSTTSTTTTTSTESSISSPSSSSSSTEQKPQKSAFPPRPAIDEKLVEDFLNGVYCLHGGSGWWKYEFCYGRKVEQYHEERDGSRETILLGEYDEEANQKWLTENPEKAYKPGRKYVTHFYSGGTICDVTGRPRQVEVKFKCKESSSPSSVSMYLLEPRTCEYMLGVETPIMCPLMEMQDQLKKLTLSLLPGLQISREFSSNVGSSPHVDGSKKNSLDEDDDNEEEDEDE